MRDDERRREEGELHVKVSIKKQSQLISQPKGFGIVNAKSGKKKKIQNFFLDYTIYIIKLKLL